MIVRYTFESFSYVMLKTFHCIGRTVKLIQKIPKSIKDAAYAMKG